MGKPSYQDLLFNLCKLGHCRPTNHMVHILGIHHLHKDGGVLKMIENVWRHTSESQNSYSVFCYYLIY